MKVIRDGSLANWVSSLLGFIGGNISLATIKFCPNGSIEQIIYGMIGLIIVGFATNSDRATTWKIKSFGNLTFPPNKQGEKTPPESSLEKIISWIFFVGMALSLYFWVFY